MTTAELIEHLRTGFLSGRGIDLDLLADDIVVEWPFGRPARIEGRAAFAELAERGRAAMPFRLDHFEVRAVHEAADTVVLEYTLGGVTDGVRRTAAFVSVIRVSDGRIAEWREYQDAAALAIVS